MSAAEVADAIREVMAVRRQDPDAVRRHRPDPVGAGLAHLDADGMPTQHATASPWPTGLRDGKP